MLLLEGIFLVLRKSLGSVVRAIFGWATLALFGEVTEKDRTFLSIVVGCAAAWPVMVIGVLLPRQAAFMFALLPIPRSVPASVIRPVWIALTVLIPFLVGYALESRQTRKTRKGSRIRRLLAGVPLTLGISAAFVFAIVAVPVAKIVALAKGRKEEHVPLVIPTADYHEVAAAVAAALGDGDLSVERVRPPWTLRALSATMRKLGGATLGVYLPRDLEFFQGSELAVTIYPNGVRLLGAEAAVSRGHALITECAPRTAAFQTMSPTGQEIERHIKSLWALHADRHGITRRAQTLMRTLESTQLDYQEWETLHRQLLQLSLEARGGGTLLAVSPVRERRERQPADRSRAGSP